MAKAVMMPRPLAHTSMSKYIICMRDRASELLATMESLDRLAAWATEIKRQPLTADLTVHQAGVLHLCTQAGPLGLDELGHLLGSVPSTISALVDRLEHKGFVRRVKNPKDGRRFSVEATKRGREHYEEIDARSRAFSHTLFAEWTLRDIRLLRELVARFVDDATGLTFSTDSGRNHAR